MSAAWFVCDTPTKGSLSSLLLFPVYFPSSLSLFLLLTLYVSVCWCRREERNFVWSCEEATVEKEEGGLCALICWPAVMLWVWRGLKHITKLICPLHRQPCSAVYRPTSLLPLPFHFPTDVFVIREQRATKHRSLELSSACRPWFPDFESFVLQVMIENNYCLCRLQDAMCVYSAVK